MSTDPLLRLFTDENRVRAFAAVALGAATPTEVAGRTGLSPKDTAVALWRLREQEVITEGDDGLAVAYGHFREVVREEREQRESAEADGSGGPRGAGEDRDDAVLRTFVRDGRLVRLPAQWQRKLVVLRHIAERTFEPDTEYPERVVNERLRAWCEDAPVDHVTLRRYLVDLDHLRRQYGFYWRPEAA
jgi:hypothetical protein